MGCALSSSSAASSAATQVVVTDALTERHAGTAVIHAPGVTTATWRREDGSAVVDDDPSFEWEDARTRLCAKRVPPGRYRTRLQFAGGKEEEQPPQQDVPVCVESMRLPAVLGYTARAASSASARDGRVEAHVVAGGSAASTTTVAYLWTTGVLTQTPVLERAGPGRYAVTLVDDASQQQPLPFLHDAAPCEVGVMPRV